MDGSSDEAIKVVIERILRLVPENVAKKIVGYLYMQDISAQELTRLAFGPDTLIINLINKAKTAIYLASQPVSIPNFSSNGSKQFIGPFNQAVPISFAPFSAPATYGRVVSSNWKHLVPVHNTGLQTPVTGLEDPLEAVKLGASSFQNDYYSNEAALDNLGIMTGRVSRNYPVKTCHYFSKGYCKHGNNCRFVHGEAFPDPPFGSDSYDFTSDDQVLSPQSLEKLELDIAVLLKSQLGVPVSIASLPTLYYEKYGRTLQADGYLTESQRQGKAGYSLTKLLARLKSIRLIDRPHGQHALILADDAQKYMKIRGERSDAGPIVSASRQIYLTFPSESTFSEEEVSDYFSTFGPVEDVRIPSQQKRMFGFVTFGSAETVKMILSERNAHFICGARVLVKPYREKSKLVENKYDEKYDHPMYYQYHSHLIDIESEREAAYRRRLLQLQLSMKQPEVNPFSFSVPVAMDEIEVPEDQLKVPSAERFEHLLADILSSGDENPKCTVNDQESDEGLALPESRLASPVPVSVSAE